MSLRLRIRHKLYLKNNKIDRVDKLPEPDKDISNFSLGTFTDRSANWMVTRVRLSSPNPSCWYTEKGSKLILASKSRSARLIFVCPIVQVMVGQLRSLYLTGIEPDGTSLMLVYKKNLLGTLVFLF